MPRLKADPTLAGPAMPEGLASDLAMFNDDQIRAELEAILLSCPAVTLESAVCPALPCRAEVTSADIESLNQVVEAVSNRFQGFVTTDFHVEPARAGGTVRARFVIGSAHTETPARFDQH